MARVLCFCLVVLLFLDATQGNATHGHEVRAKVAHRDSSLGEPGVEIRTSDKIRLSLSSNRTFKTRFGSLITIFGLRNRDFTATTAVSLHNSAVRPGFQINEIRRGKVPYRILW
jgi:hypothetical protein